MHIEAFVAVVGVDMSSEENGESGSGEKASEVTIELLQHRNAR